MRSGNPKSMFESFEGIMMEWLVAELLVMELSGKDKIYHCIVWRFNEGMKRDFKSPKLEGLSEIERFELSSLTI